ncbi:HNH endonuclease [Nocardiopsis sp. EMB25]|uniref:HNH endonuclease n=1 Tax=Nocardiopsis sp. EMB25 TaxID=2835867 RepID=UPI002283AE2A|nr:HNH endonuclease signature motif containing protein [Nocardiopsis sp. EMB25]MCY9783039.1 HNH endonuclease [Nocardiopsis sp. EMB25]
MEDFHANEGIFQMIPSWQKDTLVHKLAKVVADELFLSDTDGPYVTIYDPKNGFQPKKYLPIDLALQGYGIEHTPFEIPPPDGKVVRVAQNMTTWQESEEVANACYDYFVEDLRDSYAYEDLLSRMADEVFHVVFRDRVTMRGLNSYFSMHVEEISKSLEMQEVEIQEKFTKRGSLKRKSIPTWVKRAVYFRDHGRCVSCGMDVSGLLDALSNEQFDHIVPLANYGLNDLSNIQLLCKPCNQNKSDSHSHTSDRYRRWYRSP